jgi:hypothetical protein
MELIIDVKTPKREEVEEKKTTGVDLQNEQARRFNEEQHRQSWWEAIRSSPKALLWCSYALFTCIMWGYDGLASSVSFPPDPHL